MAGSELNGLAARRAEWAMYEDDDVVVEKPTEKPVEIPLQPNEVKEPKNEDDLGVLLDNAQKDVEEVLGGKKSESTEPVVTSPQEAELVGPEVIDENERLEKIKADLKIVLMPVASALVNEPHPQYDEIIAEKKEELVSLGVNVDRFLKIGIVDDLQPKEKEVIESRKAALAEIATKINEDRNLTDHDKILLDTIGLKEEELKGVMIDIRKVESVEPVGPVVLVTEPAERKNGKLTLDERLENIREYTTFQERRRALQNELGKSEGMKQSEREKIEKEISLLNTEVERQVLEYKTDPDKISEMRPEIREAMEDYSSLLQKKYAEPGNLTNFYTMSVTDAELNQQIEKIRTMGSDGSELAADLGKELFDIGILHDLRQKINTSTGYSEEMGQYAARLTGKDFDRLIHLEDRLVKTSGVEKEKIKVDVEGNDYVVRCLAAIDWEARQTYLDTTGTKVFKLEDPSLEDKVLSRMDVKNPLHFQVARDLYRITCGEARYGVAGWGHTDPDKGGAGVIAKNDDKLNGEFMRKAINARRDIFSAMDALGGGEFRHRFSQPLWVHFDPGVSSFWEDLWTKAEKGGDDDAKRRFLRMPETHVLRQDDIAGIPQRKYAVLNVDSLRRLRFEEAGPGSVNLGDITNFSTWIKDVGDAAAIVTKETNFMKAPTFESFRRTYDLEAFGGVYPKKWGENGEVKVEKREYIIKRLEDFVEFTLTPPKAMSESKVVEALRKFVAENYLLSGAELHAMLEKFHLPMSAPGQVISNVKRLGETLNSIDPEERRLAREKAVGIGKVGLELIGDLFKAVGK